MWRGSELIETIERGLEALQVFADRSVIQLSPLCKSRAAAPVAKFVML
jgi:hypothetical protein